MRHRIIFPHPFPLPLPNQLIFSLKQKKTFIEDDEVTKISSPKKEKKKKVIDYCKIKEIKR